MKYDNDTGKNWRFDYGPGVLGSEAVYAPKVGATRHDAEDDGYVVNFVHDILDWLRGSVSTMPKTSSAGLSQKIRLPGRVPSGFHATWVPQVAARLK